MKIISAVSDIEKVSYLAENYQNFQLVTFEDQKTKPIPKNWSVYFLKNTLHNATLDLILNPKFKAIIKRCGAKHLYVFKNSRLIEERAKGLGLKLLTPKAELIERIESKVSQVDFFAQLKRHFPGFIITRPCKISYQKLSRKLGERLIAQFNLSHSGLGTFKLNKKLWQEWKNKFPMREVRVSQFVKGQTLTINLVVLPGKAVLGQPSVQLTGARELTHQEFSTVGNVWVKFSAGLKRKILSLSQKVARVLRENNFFGPAGIDFLWSGKKLYLLEINARQPASLNLESWLTKLNFHSTFKQPSTLFDCLINFWQRANFNPETAEKKKVISGGQVVLRATQKWHGILKQVPEAGIYSFENGKIVYKKRKAFLESKTQFLVHACPKQRRILPGQEILKIQTAKDFINKDLSFSQEMRELIKCFKRKIKFESK